MKREKNKACCWCSKWWRRERGCGYTNTTNTILVVWLSILWFQDVTTTRNQASAFSLVTPPTTALFRPDRCSFKHMEVVPGRRVMSSLDDSAETQSQLQQQKQQQDEQQQQNEEEKEEQQEQRRPKLIVFDLDNTLWTPELYRLRRRKRPEHEYPVAGEHVKLFEGAEAILNQFRTSRGSWSQDVRFAIASRTKSVDWAHDLLDQFGVRDLFEFVEIFPGHKRAHFENLSRDSGISYDEMMFFDDNRDGKFGNCYPISQMGVMSVHVPKGLHSEDIFHTALTRYHEWSTHQSSTLSSSSSELESESSSALGAIVEQDGTLTIIHDKKYNKRSQPSYVIIGEGEQIDGIVVMVNHEKGYGFIRPTMPRDDVAEMYADVFFHFNNLPAAGSSSSTFIVEKGDIVTFKVALDVKRDKTMAVEMNFPNKLDTSLGVDDGNQIEMRTFSMNQPFAALLANGYKTLETRNNTMFTPYPPGTIMLLHVGQRIYPDGDKHIDVMKSGGLSNDEIETLKTLPDGYDKGMIVAICEIGKTYDTTLEERCDPQFQCAVGAFGADSGRWATEIKRVEYLKKPHRISGQGGIFKVTIDKDLIPDGWNLE